MYGNIREVAVKWDSQSQSRSAWLSSIAISSISKNYRQKANVGDAFRRVLKAFIKKAKVIKVSFAFWSAIRALAPFANEILNNSMALSAVTYLKYFYLKYYLSKIFHYLHLYLSKNSTVYLILDT